jgi:hypothetical protein
MTRSTITVGFATTDAMLVKRATTLSKGFFYFYFIITHVLFVHRIYCKYAPMLFHIFLLSRLKIIHMTELLSRHLLNLHGYIGSRSFYVYDYNRPLTSYTKTKMALSDV